MKYIIIIYLFNLTMFGSTLEDGLIGWYHFDELNANDYSGFGNHGQTHGSFGYQWGFDSPALYLNGTGDNNSNSSGGGHMIIPDYEFDKMDEFNISMWVKIDSMSYDHGEWLIFWGDDFNSWLGISNVIKRPNENGKRYIQFGVGIEVYYNPPIYEYIIKPVASRVTSDIYEKSWHQFMINYRDGTLYSYIDGELINSTVQEVSYFPGEGAIGHHWWNNRRNFSSRFIGFVDDVRIYNRSLTDCEILELNGINCNPENPCDDQRTFETRIDEKQFQLVSDSHFFESSLRLTRARVFERGAIWSNYKYDVTSNFEAEIIFKIDNGNNNNIDDGSQPGADGLAFVIQNHDKNVMGRYGGGIGFEGIPNSIAIELDLFQNNENNYGDPNGHHLAIFTNGIEENTSKHTSEDSELALALLENDLMVDGSTYKIKINFNKQTNVLTTRLTDEDDNQIGLLVADNLNLETLLDLDFDRFAMIGITSATGSAYQKHEIIDFTFCSDGGTTSIESDDDIETLGQIVNDQINIKTNGLIVSEISLVDINGIEIKDLNISQNSDSILIPVDHIAQGFYILKYNVNGILRTQKFIIE